jgi:hypothetical protein
VTKATLAAATLAYGTNRTDVAVPAGTTVGGLLASFRIDANDPAIAIALLDGQSADPSATIGGDLPSGVLLNVIDANATIQALAEAAKREANAGFAGRAAAIVNIIFGAALGLGLILGPLLWPWLAVGQPLRISAGMLLAVAVVVLAWRTGFAEKPAGSLIAPACFGLGAASVIDPGIPQAGLISLAVASATAAVFAVANWLRDHQHTVAAASLWGLTATATIVAVLTGANSAQLGAVLTVLGMAAVLLAPSYALPMPDSQIIDLPLLTTSAASVRAPALSAPSKITRRRVQHTLQQAYLVADAITLGGAFLATVGAALLVGTVSLANTEGQSATVAVFAVAISLALAPRDDRSRAARLAPRIASGAIVSIAALTLGGILDPILVTAGVIIVAFILAVGVAFASQRHTSAFLTRTADIVQGLALLLLLPAAFVASGAFQLIWQAAS